MLSALEIAEQANPALWLETRTKIRAANGKLIRPRANVLQRRIFVYHQACKRAGRAVRGMGLKPRKRGFSTGVACLHYMELQKGEIEAVIIGNKIDTSETVYKMMKVFAECDELAKQGKWGSLPKFGVEQAKFPHGSELSQSSAGAGGSIRGSTPQQVHGTEVAHWQDQKTTLLGLLNAVPDDPSTSIWLESTPNGTGDEFEKEWSHARWPTAEECPDGREYWREWEADCPNQPDESSEFGFVRIFAAWFEFDSAVIRLTEAQKKTVRETLDSKAWFYGEADLIARYGNERESDGMQRLGRETEVGDVWEQLAWRRMIIATKCGHDPSNFDQEYPRDPLSCIARGERVCTGRGMVPIEEVRVGDITAHGEVLGTRMNGTRRVVRLQTRLGYSLRCTTDHRIGLADGSFLVAGDCMGAKVQLEAPLFSDHRRVEQWEDFAVVRAQLEIDDNFARFLGYFVGDGSIHDATLSVVCDASDESVIEDVSRLMRRFGTPRRRVVGSNRGGIEVRLADKRIGPLLARLGLAEIGSTTHWKRKVRVPECIWRSPRGIVREFLRGLFEADGWISKTKNNVKFFTKDEQLGRDVQVLLLGFGIHCGRRIVIKHVADKEYPGYELTLHALDAQKFCDVIGFVSERKQGRSAKPIGKHGRPPTDYAMTDEVVSITPDGEEMVYDLEIKDEPMFCVAGIRVHNCFLASGRKYFDADSIKYFGQRAKDTHWEYGQIDEAGYERAVWRGCEAEMAVFKRCEHPRVGCHYLISCDSAEGDDQAGGKDPDRHSILVLRRAYYDNNGVFHHERVVARVKPPSRVPLETLATFVDLLSRLWGRCPAIIEMNNTGLALLKLCQAKGVPLWKRVDINPRSGRKEEKLGWRTTDNADYGGLRSLILSTLHKKLTGDPNVEGGTEYLMDIGCPNIVFELASFGEKDGKLQGLNQHDDDVMALAIGSYNIDAATAYAEPTIRRVPPPEWRKLYGDAEEGDGLAMRS